MSHPAAGASRRALSADLRRAGLPDDKQQEKLLRAYARIVKGAVDALDETIAYGRTPERAARLARWEGARAAVLRRLAVLPIAPLRPATTPLADRRDERKPCDAEHPCCPRRDEYNGYGSDGPTIFTCPRQCPCHD